LATDKGMRVYQLAKVLNVDSKQLIDYCGELGFDIKNQLSALTNEQVDALTTRSKQGAKSGASASVAPAPAPVIKAPLTNRVQNLPPRAVNRPAEPPPPEPTPAPAPEVAAPTATIPEPPPPTPEFTPPPETPAAPPRAAPPTVAAGPSPATPIPSRPPVTRPNTNTGAPMRNLGGSGNPPRPDGGSPPTRVRTPLLPRGRSSYGVVTRDPQAKPPPSLRPATPAGPPKTPSGVKKIANIPEHLMKGDQPITAQAVMAAQRPVTVGAAPVTDEEETDESKGKGKVRPGGVIGRDQRRAQRDIRSRDRKDVGVQLQGGQVVVLEDDRPGRKLRRPKLKPKRGTEPRKGKVQITPPITIRALCEALGLAFPKIVQKLTSLGVPFAAININAVIDTEMAELVAADHEVELEIRKPQDAEEQLLASMETPDEEDKLEPRAPIVTIMGHVDHGKTSLLDRIRRSNVVDTEAGGITQVIRAWRVEHAGKWITFLDTPGHEAFTKMRARGAQVTDIAVIVVAATDGVMPQTEEAINHAKAAGVSIVVAINKVDMPNANVLKTRQQLYGLEVLPDNMGGDVPFVETSAATGQGMDELLEAILLVAELKELKANPNKSAQGTCLEAHLRGDEGVFATLLVRQGTLHKGDMVICGAAFGRVRAMYNDLGRAITEAGPSVPARITGLDQVPNADDAFHVVADQAIAREIAEKRNSRLQAESMAKGTLGTLESLTQTKVSELKVILKADFRGSIEAIRKELEKFEHDEVRVRLLHAGIGAITVSDVQLALTSPKDTIIVGFNCVPDDEALRLAEDRGVQIREYNIIYNLATDIKAALEGRLKPKEEVIHLGRAIVRETFKISRVGTIAGCYVTQGTIERSAKVRVIRGGVVIYPPAERTASLESLKRFKEDVREVNEGYECGLKIAGYDDIKVDDAIEAYRIEQVQRTL
jgi:translation initiation factor IF-2